MMPMRSRSIGVADHLRRAGKFMCAECDKIKPRENGRLVILHIRRISGDTTPGTNPRRRTVCDECLSTMPELIGHAVPDATRFYRTVARLVPERKYPEGRTRVRQPYSHKESRA